MSANNWVDCPVCKGEECVREDNEDGFCKDFINYNKRLGIIFEPDDYQILIRLSCQECGAEWTDDLIVKVKK